MHAVSNLHIRNVDRELKELADQRAKSEGFSSLAEVMRHFVRMYANGEVETNVGFRMKDVLEGRKKNDYIELKPGQTLKDLVKSYAEENELQG